MNIGTGSYGIVHLVQEKYTCEFFVLKAMKKDIIFKSKQIEHIIYRD